MPEIDFNEVMKNRSDRVLLFLGALFGKEAADVARGVFSNDPAQFDLTAAQALLDRLSKAVDAEEARRIQQEKEKMAKNPEVSHPRRKHGRNFEGEITEQFLADLAGRLELPARTPSRLRVLLASEKVQALADANGLDIRTGTNDGYPLDHLRALEDCLQELDKKPEDRIRGFGPNSQPRDLLKEAVTVAEATMVRVKDEVTQMFLRAFGSKHGFDVRIVLRLWTKFESKEAQSLADANDVDLSKGLDGGYKLDEVRKFESLLQDLDKNPQAKKIYGLGPRSDARKLLRQLAAHKG